MYTLYQGEKKKHEWHVVNQIGEAVSFEPMTESNARILMDALNENEVLKIDMRKGKQGTILAEANQLIYGDRAEAYGPVSTSFERIAKYWSIEVGVAITAEQVGRMMITLKLSREKSKAGRDNLVDIAGYAGCIAKMQEEKAAI